ncbi:MAG: hypothetical protein NTV69_08945, partial [Caldilinea sp.]|nr:hypothetical protein [Caldilinea sp.]
MSSVMGLGIALGIAGVGLDRDLLHAEPRAHQRDGLEQLLRLDGRGAAAEVDAREREARRMVEPELAAQRGEIALRLRPAVLDAVERAER